MKKAVNNIAEDKLSVETIKNGTSREKELSFTALYNRYFQLMLFKIMGLMKGDRDVAEDLTQEIFAKAFAKIEQYDGTYAFSTWLFNIAKHHVIDAKRKSRVEVFSLESLKTSSDDGEDTTERLFQLSDQTLTGNIMEAINRQERIAAAQEAIESIKNPKHKLVLMTCEYEDLSYEEASKKLDMPVGTVKALLFRAKQDVKEFLATKKEFDVRAYQRVAPQTIVREHKKAAVQAVKALREEFEMA